MGARIGIVRAQAAAPSAFAAFAQCERRNTVRQGGHDLASFRCTEAEPAADLAPRTATADAKSGFRIEDADLDAGRFYFLRRERVHDGQDRLVRQCRRHGSGIVLLENAMRRNGFQSWSPRTLMPRDDLSVSSR
jgi:hypothetical protein